MKSFFSSMLLILFGLACFAQNKEIETSAEIKSVTVYNSSAELNYQKTVSLPQGKTVLVFTDLSPFIVENTINVSTSGKDVDIITVVERINYTREIRKQNERINMLLDSISLFENEVGLLKCRIDALSIEKELLFKGESIGGVSKGVQVAEIQKASEFFSKRYLELSTELFTLTQKDKALQNNISKYRNQINQLSSGVQKSSSEVRVTVLSSVAQNVVFNLRFLTAMGGWAPFYDFKYQGQGVPLKFVFRANVFNASGVSWDNVDIKLSTANPTVGFKTPDLNGISPVNVNVKDVQFKQISVINAIAEYDIKHKYTIPSDSKPYLVDVSSFEIMADYYYLIIPKLDPFGFLMARIPDWNKYNLIPGTANIYNKGSFMGKTFLNTYAKSDTLSLYLGKDKVIQSLRNEVNSDNERNIVGNYYVERAEISVAIKNNSNEKINIQMLDQVPVIDEKDKSKLSIENIEQAMYSKFDGLLTWNFQIGPNESKEISFKYEVKSPKNETGYYRPNLKRLREISCPQF